VGINLEFHYRRRLGVVVASDKALLGVGFLVVHLHLLRLSGGAFSFSFLWEQ
jgi:hypothetical protein